MTPEDWKKIVLALLVGTGIGGAGIQAVDRPQRNSADELCLDPARFGRLEGMVQANTESVQELSQQVAVILDRYERRNGPSGGAP